MEKYIIEDWAGNRISPNKVFDSFEDGWEWIMENIEEEEEEDGTYDDYYRYILKTGLKTFKTHNNHH